MKTIYIKRRGLREERRRWPWILVLLFFVMIGIARVIAPYAIVSYINNKRANESCLTYRISDVDLKLLETKIFVDNFRVYSSDGNTLIAEFTGGKIDIDPFTAFRDKNFGDQYWSKAEITLSESLFQEIQRLKDESIKKTDIDKIQLAIGGLDLKQIDEKSHVKSLLTLRDLQLKFQDDLFKFDSGIKEGGYLHLEGQSQNLKDHLHWSVAGSMSGINASVLEKLAGGSLPIEIKEANIDAKISAHSEGDEIRGVITPNIKNFRLKDEKGNTVARAIAKVSNFLAKKASDDKEPEFSIPFTLKENLTLDFSESLKQWFSPRAP